MSFSEMTQEQMDRLMSMGAPSTARRAAQSIAPGSLSEGDEPTDSAEDMGIEIGVDEGDDDYVAAAMYQDKLFYWTGDGFSTNREDGLARSTSEEADGDLADVEEYINGDMGENSADPLTLTLHERGNPWHAKENGRFTSRDSVNRSGRGSLSLKTLPQSKQKVAGTGKNGPKMVKTPNICGRAARKKGMNVRCWTGTPFPDDFGKTPKNLTAKGQATKNIGAGRGWRKGQKKVEEPAKQRVRRTRGEWVDVDLGSILFEVDLNESANPSWSYVFADRLAFVQQEGDAFVWQALMIEDRTILDEGQAASVEEAWSDALVGMGFEFVETSTDRDLDHNKPIVISGVKGMKSKPATKKFKNYAAFRKWLDKEDSDAADWDIQYMYNESEFVEETECGRKAGPRWRKNPRSAADRLRALV